ncbi:hypothetical protein B0T19DRAFT_152062 [Cercophora scortea]|uniref:Uncharacterized protein n=1 Tax=Cercophora scortea TaxID=314031 RepID=A0AAE0ILN9_9PEZI|nr:hypothetical protein B0T19DRAFT_152062 [Cercophora scortea]
MTTMFRLALEGVVWCLALVQLTFAQQFANHTSSYETFGLSQGCFETLNTTVACSYRLSKHTMWDTTSVGYLDTAGLAEVCLDSCRNSLVDLRSAIQLACDNTTDTITHTNVKYPATYLVDTYLYFYDVSCYRSKATGEFCDATHEQWNTANSATPHECDECTLGPLHVQASSPIGYTKERASDLDALLSKCDAVVDYPYTAPEPYGELQPPVPVSSAAAESPNLIPTTRSCSRMKH